MRWGVDYTAAELDCLSPKEWKAVLRLGWEPSALERVWVRCRLLACTSWYTAGIVVKKDVVLAQRVHENGSWYSHAAETTYEVRWGGAWKRQVDVRNLRPRAITVEGEPSFDEPRSWDG